MIGVSVVDSWIYRNAFQSAEISVIVDDIGGLLLTTWQHKWCIVDDWKERTGYAVNKRSLVMALGATSLVAVIAGCGTQSASAASSTVATVGSTNVTSAELANFVNGTEFLQETTFPSTKSEKTLEVKALVAQTAVNQWALKHHLTTEKKAKASASSMIKNEIEAETGGASGLSTLLKSHHLTSAGLMEYITNQEISASAFTKVTKDVKAPTVSQEEAYYAANKSSFESPQQDELSDIVVKSKSLAAQLLTEAKAGDNFASLAKKYSIASTGKTGGSLGYLALSDTSGISEDMYDAVAGLKAGAFTSYKGTKGYQVVWVQAIKPESVESFSSVQSEIKSDVAQTNDDNAYQAWTKKLEKTVKISIKS